MKALLLVSWLLANSSGAGAASAAGIDARSEPEKARYEAACAFLGDEVRRLDAIVEKSIAGDELLREDRDSGAMLLRHRDAGVRIDYIVTAGGKVIVSRAELAAGYLGKRLTARSLQSSLNLPHVLPKTFKTGCDRLYLTVWTHGPHIASMTIDVDMD
ncbi:hypothetical protein SAMN05216204_11532 [Massilia yuzhufengensis]|uniref:Uncharacterized protein n=2 Tax=Massilia yuzhufengensis TaxID=1164594 RepID=A0A1I1P7T0_9BURK|nr:hypothetical protein SAMN05216204_11532 [Massilia yuzhufengensis]